MSRRTPPLLFAAGCVLVLATLALGLGTVPWVLGLLLLLVAVAIAAARRGGILAAGGIVVALVAVAVAIALPGWLAERDADAALAWSTQPGERIVAASDAIAITVQKQTVRGRDAATGRVRWTRRGPLGRSVGRWMIAGDHAVVGGGLQHRVAILGLGDGRTRWEAGGRPDEDGPVLRATSDRTLGVVFCPLEAERCRVEARDLDTGTVRWRDEVALDGRDLGVPAGPQSGSLPEVGPQRQTPWVALVAPGDENEPRALRVRELDSGRVVRRTPLAPVADAAIAGGALVTTGGPTEEQTQLQASPLTGDGPVRRREADGARLGGSPPGTSLEVREGWLPVGADVRSVAESAAGAGGSSGGQDAADDLRGLPIWDPSSGRSFLAPLPSAARVAGIAAGPDLGATAATSTTLVLPYERRRGGRRLAVVDVTQQEILRTAPTTGTDRLAAVALPSADTLVLRGTTTDLIGRDREAVTVETLAGRRVARWTSPSLNTGAVEVQGPLVVIDADGRDRVLATSPP